MTFLLDRYKFMVSETMSLVVFLSDLLTISIISIFVAVSISRSPRIRPFVTVVRYFPLTKLNLTTSLRSALFNTVPST